MYYEMDKATPPEMNTLPQCPRIISFPIPAIPRKDKTLEN